MTATTTQDPTVDEARQGEFIGRLFNAGIGAIELVTIDIGERLGLYEVLNERGRSTSDELADAAGIHPRYAREWLEQQAVAGILEVDSPAAEADDRRYSLPTAHADVLLTPDSMSYLAPVAAFVPLIGKVYDALLDAYRTGGGVPYADYEVHDIQAGFNRAQFVNLLATDWLPRIPDVEARLRATASARVAEIGCGEGWLAITLAKAYPEVTVDGFDVDEASIAAARRNAADSGVADRVRFEVRDGSEDNLEGTYDLVVAFEMVHDVADPVDVLRTLRRLRADGGAVLVVDERTADTFTAPGDELERFFYGVSLVHCLPVGMADQPSAGTGTVMRSDTLRHYATQAGFSSVDVLPIDHMMFRFYRLEG